MSKHLSQTLFWPPFLKHIFFIFLFQKCRCFLVLQLWAIFFFQNSFGKVVAKTCFSAAILKPYRFFKISFYYYLFSGIWLSIIKCLYIWCENNLKILNSRGVVILRVYYTTEPYFWRLCVNSQKIKQLWTKYPMDLIRIVPRNSKITVSFQLATCMWSNCK